VFTTLASAEPPNFCPEGSNAGKCQQPRAVAVDPSSGDVYVGDGNNRRIDVFDSNDRFIRAFGEGVVNGAEELQACEAVCIQGRLNDKEGTPVVPGAVDPVAIAVDPSTHDVYVADGNTNRIEKFAPTGGFLFMTGKGIDRGGGTPAHPGDICTAEYLADGDVCREGLEGKGPGAFAKDAFAGETIGLAVDPTSHDLWVGDNERVQRFSQEGEYISELALPGARLISSLAFYTDPITSFEYFYTVNPPVDEVQVITPPASGTYTLTFEGQTTTALPSDATETEVSHSLQALSTIGPGNADLFNGRVTFGGTLADTDVPQLTISAGSVTTEFQGGTSRLLKFDSVGNLVEELDTSGHPNAIAVDPASGNLFVGDCPIGGENGFSQPCKIPETLLEFDPTGVQTEAFGTGEVLPGGGPSIAFDGIAQRLDVAGDSGVQAFPLPGPGPLPVSGTSEAKAITKVSTTLCAEVNPEGASTTAHFEYIAEAQFKTDGDSFGAGTLTTTESASLGSDFSAHEVCHTVSALQSATGYRFRVVAHNANANAEGVDGEVVEFVTLPPAAIESSDVVDVTANSVTFEAEINPLGDATSYRFEYLTEAEYLANGETFAGAVQAPAVPLAIGAGSTYVAVSQHVQGLLPGTAYRFRAVVLNAVSEAHGGPFGGSVSAFVTQVAATFVLPDQRAWEQVSPPEKRGADLTGHSKTFLLQAAASGDAISYLASAPTEALPQGNSNATQLLSARGPGGWSTHDLVSAHATPTTVSTGAGTEYRFFSSDLSLGVFEHFGRFEASLSPSASEETTYLHANFPPGDPTAFCTESCYRPLFASCPSESSGEPCPAAIAADADVPAGIQFAQKGECARLRCGPSFKGATADLRHVVLQAGALSSDAGAQGGLYLYSSGATAGEALRKVNILPNGAPSPGGEGVVFLGSQAQKAHNAISANGSRVVFSTSSGHLYLRVNATEEQSAVGGGAVDGSQCSEATKACTLQLDVLQGGPGGSQPPGPFFQLASVEGSRVFFTDSQQLTPDSGAGEDLYEYDLDRPPGQRLVDLTPQTSGEAATVDRFVLGASEDTSYIYLVAKGALTGAEENGRGETARAGEPNLYLLHAGTISFLAVLSPKDDGVVSPADLRNLTARVSPDGRWLALMSERSLTGYDNHDALNGRLDQEVFLYHAAANGRQGQLVCASCNPSGARPVGGNIGENESWAAASVPAWTGFETGAPLYQSRYLSDGGRLFFNSADALVASDTDGTADVYEYEPTAGAEEAPPNDTCTETASTYSRAAAGCVGLISSGTSPEQSSFIDASESGNDVFFLTDAKLVGGDFDTSHDYYDARVGGGFPESAKPVECSGDSCQSLVAAPEDPTPGSLSFQGPGNLAQPVASTTSGKAKPLTRARKLARALKACEKRPKRRRLACIRQAHRAYGATGKAKSSNGRAR
jgi:DNA-binding beta-propeller fold protein YncE